MILYVPALQCSKFGRQLVRNPKSLNISSTHGSKEVFVLDDFPGYPKVPVLVPTLSKPLGERLGTYGAAINQAHITSKASWINFASKPLSGLAAINARRDTNKPRSSHRFTVHCNVSSVPPLCPFSLLFLFCAFRRIWTLLHFPFVRLSLPFVPSSLIDFCTVAGIHHQSPAGSRNGDCALGMSVIR